MTMFLHDHLGSQPFSQLWISPENLSLNYLFGPHALGHSMVLFMNILVPPKNVSAEPISFLSIFEFILFEQSNNKVQIICHWEETCSRYDL